jgi:hypothetical protein
VLFRSVEEKILGLYLWQQQNEKSTIDLEKFRENYDRIAGIKLAAEVGTMDEKTKSDLVFQAEMYYPEEKVLVPEAEELLNNFEKETLEEKLPKLMHSLREAETNKDEKESERIFKECHEITKRINEIKSSRFIEK